MVEALRESMDILRAEQAARTIKGETGADEWLEQITKSFEILDIWVGELWVVLASYQLKGDADQWWKYAKGQIEHTWEEFSHAFQEKYLSPTTRERLWREFEELEQFDSTVAEFEATFKSLSHFAPDLVAMKVRRCLEFEKRLRPKILMSVMGNMNWDYERLVEFVAHIKIMLEGEEKRRQLKRQGFTKSRGGSMVSKKSKSSTSSHLPSLSDVSANSLSEKSMDSTGQSGITCYRCSKQGHKSNTCPRRGNQQPHPSIHLKNQTFGGGQSPRLLSMLPVGSYEEVLSLNSWNS
ncbi:uncharacterized protein LOC114289892 [Camellia sinensis]|uniref:uncharacterized protein LOC114289892 n=1 Tax=Camellia sinensis TaxID=4442 RepID=UPI00103607BB|nr:uncharacterized protein LOC114289892 [Camellia sinensis]